LRAEPWVVVHRESSPLKGNEAKDFSLRQQYAFLYSVPGGTKQNSPPFQRWVRDTKQTAKSRQGRHDLRRQADERIGPIRKRKNQSDRIFNPRSHNPPLKRWAILCRPETGLKHSDDTLFSRRINPSRRCLKRAYMETTNPAGRDSVAREFRWGRESPRLP
jgi:hypothetical protein